MPETIGIDGRLKDRTGIAPQGVIVRAWLTANQAVTNSTWTKILFTVKEDPYGWWDLTTGRFTPKVAGYYRISGALLVNISASQQVLLAIYRNGTVVRRMSQVSNSRTSDISVSGGALIYLNGSTDYIEIWGYTDATPFRGDAPELTYVDINLTATSVGVVSEPWHVVGAAGEPAMVNGWVNYGTSLAFMKDPHGFVHIKGELQAGTLTAGTTIFTLPVGYRPAYRRYWAVPDNLGNSQHFQIQPTGSFQVSDGRAAISGTVPNLGELIFRAEQ